jgi:hypothetical protein
MAMESKYSTLIPSPTDLVSQNRSVIASLKAALREHPDWKWWRFPFSEGWREVRDKAVRSNSWSEAKDKALLAEIQARDEWRSELSKYVSALERHFVEYLERPDRFESLAFQREFRMRADVISAECIMECLDEELESLQIEALKAVGKARHWEAPSGSCRGVRVTEALVQELQRIKGNRTSTKFSQDVGVDPKTVRKACQVGACIDNTKFEAMFGKDHQKPR